MRTTEEDYRIVVCRTISERRVDVRNKDGQAQLFRFIGQRLRWENKVLYDYVKVLQTPKRERSLLNQRQYLLWEKKK